MTIPSAATPLRHTPLHALHFELGARMVAFAGYHMPVQYPGGIIKEHLHTRSAAGLFDVSHMGQIVVRPHSGNITDAARALERIVPADIVGLAEGSQRYAFFTAENGGIIDDLMVAHRGDHLGLVVNASRKEIDEQHLRDALADACSVELLDDRALLALQGPAAEAVLTPLAPAVASMRFMAVQALALGGIDCVVSRSGYTGEDGFEISLAAHAAEQFARALLAHELVAPVGLGARDSLRLEAGLCLYGADIDLDTTPAAAALTWAIPRVRRRGGERQGGFPGADTILGEIDHGCPRRRVGLRSENRTPVRAGAPLYPTDSGGAPIGAVSSGGFGPSVGAPVAMGYVPTDRASPGSRLFAEVRGNRVPVQVTALPFVPHRYRRS